MGRTQRYGDDAATERMRNMAGTIPLAFAFQRVEGFVVSGQVRCKGIGGPCQLPDTS